MVEWFVEMVMCIQSRNSIYRTGNDLAGLVGLSCLHEGSTRSSFLFINLMDDICRWGSLAMEKAICLGPPVLTVILSGRASGVKLCCTILAIKR